MTDAHSTVGDGDQTPMGLLTVQVVRREMAARDVVALWLAQPGTQRAPAPYQPGQFITLALPSASDTLYRSYSLCGYGRSDRPWEITVKRQHAGAVSTFLYEHAAPGMLLYAREPRGAFTLPERVTPDLSLIFVAAGSGIAPVYGMLRALAHLPEGQRPHAALHYASNSPADVIYGHELAALDPEARWLRQWHYLTSHGERLTPELALRHMGAAATASQWYICGPEALKRSMQGALTHHGVPAERVHVEVFGNQEERVAAYSRPQRQDQRRAPGATGGARATWLRLADSGAALDVQAGETLLAALERQGYHPDASCRAGSCGTCRIRLLTGRVATDAAEADGLTAEEHAAGYVLTCVARPLGDVTLATGGRAPRGTAVASSARADAGAGPRGAGKVALRIGMVAASLALFSGAWSLTNSSPFATAGGQGASPSAPAQFPSGKQQPGQHGASSITATPVRIVPNATTGVS